MVGWFSAYNPEPDVDSDRTKSAGGSTAARWAYFALSAAMKEVFAALNLSERIALATVFQEIPLSIDRLFTADYLVFELHRNLSRTCLSEAEGSKLLEKVRPWSADRVMAALMWAKRFDQLKDDCSVDAYAAKEPEMVFEVPEAGV